MRHLDPRLLSLRRGTGIKVGKVRNLYKVAIPFFTYRYAPHS